MKINSLFSNILHDKYSLICMFVVVILTGCYSFTGGASKPEYLKTLYISTVIDNSGYGNPVYKNELTQKLIENFKKDNTFILVDRAGDAKLNVLISSIKDETTIISPGERETERKITVACEAEYYDGIKKKTIWKKSFSNYQIYELALAQQAREAATKKALESISDDILLAVVTGW